MSARKKLPKKIATTSINAALIADRPSWCPDQTCAARGTVSAFICGGVAIGLGRLCLRFEEPRGVRTLDSISAQENVELRTLLNLLHLESGS